VRPAPGSVPYAKAEAINMYDIGHRLTQVNVGRQQLWKVSAITDAQTKKG
jgi:hypothetical protein